MSQVEDLLKQLLIDFQQLEILANNTDDPSELRLARTWLGRWSALRGATDGTLDVWIAEASATHLSSSAADAYEAKRSFIQWQQRGRVENFCKGAYSWIRKANDTSNELADTIHLGKVVVDP